MSNRKFNEEQREGETCLLLGLLVGETGLEPGTSCMSSRQMILGCSSLLRLGPSVLVIYTIASGCLRFTDVIRRASDVKRDVNYPAPPSSALHTPAPRSP